VLFETFDYENNASGHALSATVYELDVKLGAKLLLYSNITKALSVDLSSTKKRILVASYVVTSCATLAFVVTVFSTFLHDV